MSEFTDNIRRLSAEIGVGLLHGEVEVNQVYAHYQHEHPEFRHPDGGKAFYLRDPLFTRGPSDFMRNLAEHAITADGTDLHAGAIENMEQLSLDVYEQAPWEFGDLRASGHPKVTQGGGTIYDRQPNVHRLSEQELKAKSQLRNLFDPNRYGPR